jgi:hypothetical protein
MYEPVDALRSRVPDGRFELNNWRVVGRLADLIEQASVDVYGGPEGFVSYPPRIVGG